MIEPVKGASSHPMKRPSEEASSQNPDQKTAYQRTSFDPAGIWAKFLGRGGEATPEEVKLFVQGLEKMLQVVVQRDLASFKRSMQKLREAQEGN